MAPSSTAIPPLYPTTTIPLLAELCRPVDLNATIAGSYDNHFSVTTVVVLTVLGVGPCLLALFPDITIVTSGGESLPIQYASLKDPIAPSYFLAEPGQPVGFYVGWMNWCQAPVAQGVTIRLRLSEQMMPVDIPTGGAGQSSLPVQIGGKCTDSATESQVSISRIVYGIPDVLGP